MNTLTTEDNAAAVEYYLAREIGILTDPRLDSTTAAEVLAAIEVMAATAVSTDPRHSPYDTRCKAALGDLAAALRFVRGEITDAQYFETEGA